MGVLQEGRQIRLNSEYSRTNGELRSRAEGSVWKITKRKETSRGRGILGKLTQQDSC